MKKLKWIVFSAFLSVLIANLAFMVLQGQSLDYILHDLLGSVTVYILIYALVPAIILGILSLKNKNNIVYSLLIPFTWVFLVIAFFAYANDILKYGLDFSLYEFKSWLFSFNRIVVVIIPALLQGVLFWFSCRMFKLYYDRQKPSNKTSA